MSRIKLPGHFRFKTVLSTLTTPTHVRETGAVRKPLHLVVHLDINKTVVMADAVQGKSERGVINDMLTESCWGTIQIPNIAVCSRNPLNAINGEEWIPDASQPICSLQPDAEHISYAGWVRGHLSYGGGPVVNAIKQERKRYLLTFTEESRNGHCFRPLFERVHDALQKGAQPFATLNQPRCLLVPAFYKLIDSLCAFQLANASWFSFSIVFRTFGTDLDEVSEELNAYCEHKGYDGSGEAPDLRLHSANTGALTRRYEHRPLSLSKEAFSEDSSLPRLCPSFLLMGTTARHHLDNDLNVATHSALHNRIDELKALYKEKHNPGVEMLESMEDIYGMMKERSLRGSTLALSDDWIWWALHGESSEFGKLLLVDSRDSEGMKHIFFDDNILFDEPYIVDVRDVSHTPCVPLAEENWTELQHSTLVKTEPLEVILDEDYFIDWIVHTNPQLMELTKILS